MTSLFQWPIISGKKTPSPIELSFTATCSYIPERGVSDSSAIQPLVAYYLNFSFNNRLTFTFCAGIDSREQEKIPSDTAEK